MAEPRLVVEHREHLWYLLAEASQLEHMIMCQYLYAGFSLKRDSAEGLTAEQAAAVARWREVLRGIAGRRCCILRWSRTSCPRSGLLPCRPGPTSRLSGISPGPTRKASLISSPAWGR